MKLLVCPDCSRKGVYVRMTTSEDHWYCRYCEWWAYTDGYEERDQRRRLQAANPDSTNIFDLD